MTLQEQIEWNLAYYSKKFNLVQKTEELFKELNVLELSGDLWCHVDKPEIRINAFTIERARELMKIFLPRMKRFTKEFEPLTNQFTLRSISDELKVSITYGTPSTCTIKVIEEPIEIPAVEAQPARIELRKKYIPEGDCNPVLDVNEIEEK